MEESYASLRCEQVELREEVHRGGGGFGKCPGVAGDLVADAAVADEQEHLYPEGRWWDLSVVVVDFEENLRMRMLQLEAVVDDTGRVPTWPILRGPLQLKPPIVLVRPLSHSGLSFLSHFAPFSVAPILIGPLCRPGHPSSHPCIY